MFTDPITLFAFLVTVPPLIILSQLYLLAATHRRFHRLLIRPIVRPTTDATMPPFFRDSLGRLTHSLRALGFHAAASGHASLGPRLFWIQVVFTHPDHHRCSAICVVYRTRRAATFSYGFASESLDGASAKTMVGTPAFPNAHFRTDGDRTAPETVAAAYQAHLERVRATLADKLPAPIPAPGAETPWLAVRAANITRGLASKRHLRPSLDGLWYTPKWKDSLGATWRQAFPFRLFLKTRTAPATFDVLPTRADT